MFRKTDKTFFNNLNNALVDYCPSIEKDFTYPSGGYECIGDVKYAMVDKTLFLVLLIRHATQTKDYTYGVWYYSKNAKEWRGSWDPSYEKFYNNFPLGLEEFDLY